MFFLRLKTCMKTVVAAAIALFVFLSFSAFSVCKLSAIEGEKTFFLDSASSQGVRATELSPFQLFRVKGESVCIKTDENTLERILSLYDAKVRFTEKVSGVTSYYCYTEKWSNGIMINGVKINLHIAVGESQTFVGTPIIFGGY